MYCPDCQQEVPTYPNAHASGVQHCAQCRQVVSDRPAATSGERLTATDGGLHVDATMPLTEGVQADKFWRIDVDLQTCEQMVRAWRRRESVPSKLESCLRRIDPPESVVPGAEHAVDGRETPAEAPPRSADSIVSLVICELMAIGALMMLLVIEAQHSPHFVKFAAAALVGAAAVLLLTFVRWKIERQSAQQSGQHPTAAVSPPAPKHSTRPAAKSSYRDLTRRTRPAGWG